VDYNSGPYEVVFLPGTTRVSLEVVIHVDDVLEDRERFRLLINKNFLPNDITIGEPGRATVTIFG